MFPIQLLHLHPLTLEDILQKEQREKFELFPRLGYYFVVFRAIERPTTDPTTHVPDDESSIGESTVQDAVDVVEATNVYLVVFKEGICTFHFEDISAHTEAVRRKLLHLEETFRMSSGQQFQPPMTRINLLTGFVPLQIGLLMAS